jgi:hypothetical protein
MNSKNLFSLLAFTLILQACSSEVEDVNKKVDNSSFELGQIEMVSAEVQASNSVWPDLRDKALVSLRTCITDIAYLEKIAGEKFSIKTPSQNSTRVTNAQGCITWTEKVDFNYLEDEKYIKVAGAIEAEGNFKGKRNFQLAINPWREQAVDLGFGRVQTTQSALTMEEIEKGQRIAVTNASLSIISHKFHTDQTELALEIITNPMLIRRNLTGAVVREKFNGGKFDVSYYLITKNVSSNQRNVISQVDKLEVITTDGRLASKINFVISEGIDPKDVVEVAIKITAHNAPFDLGTTEGLLPIRQLSGTTSSDLLEIPQSIAQIINSKRPQDMRAPTPDDFGFIIDSISVEPGSEGGENLAGTNDRRIVDSNMTVCLVDSLIKDSIRNYPFQIKFLDEDKSVLFDKTVTTELRTGCAVFRVSLPYRRYDQPRWKKYKLVVGSTREPFENISKERTVSINPWIRTGDFGIDSQVGAPPTVTIVNKPKIFIPGLNYNFLGHAQTDVKLNKGLDLQFTRSYMIEMQPQVFLNHRFEGDTAGQEPLMTGNYKLRFLILAPKPGINVDFTAEVKLDDYYTLTGAEKNVSAENGFVRTKVDLPLLMTDLMALSFKNIVLVQLSALDGSSLQTGYFVGVFNGSRRQDNIGSSLESKRELSTRDLNISRSLITRMSNLKNKLASDAVIPNNKDNFIATLQAELKGTVPTINHTTYAVQNQNISFASYNSEATFKTGQGLVSGTPAISTLIDNPRTLNAQLIDDLCHVFYNKNTVTKQTTTNPSFGMAISMPIDTSITGFEHKRCKANFAAHVQLQSFHHIASITAQPTALMTEAGSLNRSNGTWISDGNTFTRSTGYRESDFFQRGWNVHAGLSFHKIVSLGADYGVSGGYRNEYFSADNNDRALGQFKRVDNTVSTRYSFDRFRVSYQARVIKCLMITPKIVSSEIPARHITPTILDAFRREGPKKFDVTSSKRIYVCKANTDAMNYNDSFYFVRNGEQGMMSDVEAATGQFVSVIRGDKTFNRFRSTMIESDKALVIIQTKDDSLANRFNHHMQNNGSGLDYKRRMDFAFPGLIEL